MDLNEISVFIAVARAKSFTRAAEALGSPKSTVSAKIASLEDRLGVRLIQRTTRAISLTETGESFFRDCVDSVDRLLDAEQLVLTGKGEARGRLVITAPVFLGSSILPRVLLQYAKDYPGVEVDLRLTDRPLDLVRDRVDLAIRGGRLQDSSLAAKRVGHTYFALYAAPVYFEARQKLSQPKELVEHACIQIPALGLGKWTLVHAKGQELTISVSGPCTLDDMQAAKECALEGLGIALLPTFVCLKETRNRELIRILPEWRSQVRPISFVHPSGRFLPPKVKAFMQLAEKAIKETLAKA